MFLANHCDVYRFFLGVDQRFLPSLTIEAARHTFIGCLVLIIDGRATGVLRPYPDRAVVCSKDRRFVGPAAREEVAIGNDTQADQ